MPNVRIVASAILVDVGVVVTRNRILVDDGVIVIAILCDVGVVVTEE